MAQVRVIVRFVVFYLLFGCFPIAVGGGLLFYTLHLEEDARRAEFKQSLDHETGALLRRTDPRIYLQNRLGNFIQAVFKSKDPPARLEHLRKKILPQWDVVFDPCLFNAEGKLVTPGTIPLKNRFIVQKFYDCLMASPSASEKEFQKHRKKISALFGSGFQLGVVKTRENQISFFRTGGSDGALMWKQASQYDKSGMILIAWEFPAREFLLEKYSRREFKHLWLMSRESGTMLKTFGRPVSAIFENAEKSFALYGNPFFWSEQFLWKNTFADRLNLLIGKQAENVNLEKHRELILWLTSLFVLFSFLLWHRLFFSQDRIYLSIRMKLVGLFLLAMGFPLMGVAFLGSQTLKDRESMLVTKTIKEAKTLLSTLDADFSHEAVDFAQLCRQIRDDPLLKSSPERIKEKTDRLQNEQRILYFEARSLAGDILAKTFITGYFEGLEDFFDSFGKFCIMQNLSDLLRISGSKINRPPDQVIQNLLESHYLGVVHILTRADSVHITQLGENHFFWFWDVIRNSRHSDSHDGGSGPFSPGWRSFSGPVAYMTVLQSLDSAYRKFLDRRLPSLKDQQGKDFLILGREDESGRWFPSGVPVPRDFETLMDGVRIAQDSVLERLNYRGRTYVAMGFPGKTMKGIGLLALYPNDKIVERVQTLRISIYLGILLTLFFSVLIGIVLSKIFLRPVSELSNGMLALQARNTEFRVPVLQNDELGALGNAFNRMVEDLNEMALAAVVQETLIPQKLPQVPGYEIKLGNITASKLGGDYCDFISLSHGNYLLVMGDVTGHGVGAALLMAMVKAAVIDFVGQKDDLMTQKGRLIGLMHHLNRMVLQLMKRQIMMTFSALLLNPDTGRLRFANAGHPFPLHCKKNGSIGELELHHFPLGVTDKPGSFELLESEILPGETVVMLTDGYYEATNENGEMFGFERIFNLLRAVSALSPGEIYQKMIESLRKFRIKSSLDDDCSILILKRSEKSAENL